MVLHTDDHWKIIGTLHEDAICKSLISAILGRDADSLERDTLALPLQYGGIGIRNRW